MQKCLQGEPQMRCFGYLTDIYFILMRTSYLLGYSVRRKPVQPIPVFLNLLQTFTDRGMLHTSIPIVFEPVPLVKYLFFSNNNRIITSYHKNRMKKKIL